MTRSGKPEPARGAPFVTRRNPSTLWDMAANGFSQISVAEPGRLAFVSGQIALGPAAPNAPGDLAHQARIVVDNLAAALEELGASVGDVVMLRVYVVDATNDKFLDALAPIREWLGDEMPSISTIGVRALPIPERLVEIEMTARVPGEPTYDAASLATR